ncbi:MAG: zinc ribbon domain-containing protein [Gemmatimonadota bacterium]|nr:zinc ribbon domain-containing protein [Gemmatimonadota bacterium]MDH4350169.1 zinc ribbon domain-containing protein [Gemmatimonadota bacterium]MDH5196178.1 zinc ribbon domain-containing protein [Gemmatimonadota bacterium]
MALIEPGDVARLFNGLVAELAERDPGRLRSGFQVAELYQQIVPYRTHRTKLGFVSNQDYEGAILGLLAGLGGYATVEPAEVQDTLAAEVDSPNPDTTLFREFAGARIRLDAARVQDVLDDDQAYAPPPAPGAAPGSAPVSAPVAPPEPRAPVFELAGDVARPPVPSATPAPALTPSTTRCPGCAADLPDDRPVIFCPFCGKPVGAPTCVRCGDQLRAEWTFCPRCGHARAQ